MAWATARPLPPGGVRPYSECGLRASRRGEGPHAPALGTLRPPPPAPSPAGSKFTRFTEALGWGRVPVLDVALGAAEKAAWCVREAGSWKESPAYGEKHPLFWKKCQQLTNLGNNVLKVKCDFLE